MRASSFTMLMIALLMIIIILALIVIIGLTVMLNNGGNATEETGPFLQFITFVQEQILATFGSIQQWIDYLLGQIQNLSEML